MEIVEGSDLVLEHGREAGDGMVGRGGAGATTDGTVEAFEAAGGTEVKERPGRVASLEGEVGEGGAEVRMEATDCVWLGGAVATNNVEVATEGSG